MTDPTADINQAFDTARERERADRDDSIQDEIDTTDRIAGKMAKAED